MVDGAEQLHALARDLKAMGDKDLRRELLRGLNRATKPLKEAARRSALENLPKSGGLAELVAGSKFSTSNRLSGQNPGVRITAKSGGHVHDLEAMDRGEVRHPVYGHRKTWVPQQVRPGWFSAAMTDNVDAVRVELLAVLDDVRSKLARG